MLLLKLEWNLIVLSLEMNWSLKKEQDLNLMSKSCFEKSFWLLQIRLKTTLTTANGVACRQVIFHFTLTTANRWNNEVSVVNCCVYVKRSYIIIFNEPNVYGDEEAYRATIFYDLIFHVVLHYKSRRLLFIVFVAVSSFVSSPAKFCKHANHIVCW